MTIPQVVDGVTDADAAFMNQLVDAANQANAAFNGAGQITTAAITPALEGYVPLDEAVARTTGIVTPFEFGGVGDGSADDTTPVTSALANAIANKRTLSLCGKPWRVASALEITSPVSIDGGGWYEDDGTNLLYGGRLVFDAGVSGVTLKVGARHSRLSNIAITSLTNIFGAPALDGTETDDGLTIEAPLVYLDHVGIRFFGRRGLNVDTTGVGTNGNVGCATHLDCSYNGKQGIYIDGSNSNVWTVVHPNTSANGEEGILNRGGKNTFINPHAEANDGNLSSSYDFNDGGSASVWINPYSEQGHRFLIDTTQVTCYGGVIQTGSTFGSPVIWSGAGPSEGMFAASQAGWAFSEGVNVRNRIVLKDTVSGAHEMGIQADWSAEALVVADRTTSIALAYFYGSSGNPRIEFGERIVLADGESVYLGTATGTKIGLGATEKLGFYGATPVAQQTGVAVSAAGIHAALVALGLITA